ncbi:MAG: hypothetical protein KJ621_14405 [Proteobacteria bacterium]|nr:hypothetical protein [Pseudomonadota bacterium]MBU1741153.1 hypothetical protein [Pseudomonadota bacterium]
MRQLLLDELSAEDVDRIRRWLADNAEASGLEGVYWVDVPEDLLSDRQRTEAGGRPYSFAVEVGPDYVKLEFLVRSRYSLHHPGTDFATAPQRLFILEYSDRMLQELKVRT